MVIKQEKIQLKDKEITVKEISFAGKLRLGKIKEVTIYDWYKEALSEEDFAHLEQVGKEEENKIKQAFARVQGWDEKPLEEKTSEDFQTQP